jgi:hypothetical protein
MLTLDAFSMAPLFPEQPTVLAACDFDRSARDLPVV